MAISYNSLWKTLIDHDLKRYDLMKVAGLSANVIAKMARNEYVSLQSIEKVCIALGCKIEDVVSFSYEESSDE